MIEYILDIAPISNGNGLLITKNTGEQIIFTPANAGQKTSGIIISETTDYESLRNQPKINNVVLKGNKTTSDLGILIPTKLSQLANDSNYVTTSYHDEQKVDKVYGKGLSSNDYTITEKTKLAALRNYDDTAIKSRVTDIENKEYVWNAKLDTQYSSAQDGYIARVDPSDHKLKVLPGGTTTASFGNLTGSPRDNDALKQELENLQSDINGKLGTQRSSSEAGYILKVDPTTYKITPVPGSTSTTSFADITGSATDNTSLNTELGKKLSIQRSSSEAGYILKVDPTTYKITPVPGSTSTTSFADITGSATDNASLNTELNKKLSKRFTSSEAGYILKVDPTTYEVKPVPGSTATVSFADITGSATDNTSLSNELNKKVNTQWSAAEAGKYLKIDPTTYRIVAAQGGGGGTPSFADITGTARQNASLSSEFSTIDTNILGLESDMDIVKNDVTINKTAISTLKTDVKTAKTNITSLTTRVNTLEPIVADVQNSVDELSSYMASVKSDINVIKTDVRGVKTTVTSHEGRITTNESGISSLQTSVTELNTDMTSVKTSVNKAKNDITALQTNMGTVRNDISYLQSGQESLNTDVTGLKTDVSGIKTSISYIQPKVTTLDGKVSSMETTVAVMSTNVAYMQTKVGSLDTKVTGIDSDVTALKTNVSYLQTKVDTLDPKVTSMDTKVTNMESSVSYMQTKVNELDTKVTASVTDITNLKTNTSYLQTKVNSLDTKVTDMESDVAGVKTTSSYLQTKVGNLESKVSYHTSQIGSLIGIVNGHTTTLDAHDTKIGIIESAVEELADNVTDLTNDTTYLKTASAYLYATTGTLCDDMVTAKNDIKELDENKLDSVSDSEHFGYVLRVVYEDGKYIIKPQGGGTTVVQFSEILGNATDNASIVTELGKKVDKVDGKVLSTNDFTNDDKNKLSLSHSHTNKSILDAYDQTNSNIKDAVDKRHKHDNWNIIKTYTNSNENIGDAINKRHTHNNFKLLETYTQTEVNIKDAVTKKHSHTNMTILDNTTASFTTELNTDIANIKSYIPSTTGTTNKLTNDSDVDNKISTALASYATQGDLTLHKNNVNNPHSVTKGQVGLGNCDNTSDTDKPVSTAQQTAINNVKIQYASLPAASASLLGKVYQYTGANGTYLHNHFYECTQSGSSYVWSETAVGSGGEVFTDVTEFPSSVTKDTSKIYRMTDTGKLCFYNPASESASGNNDNRHTILTCDESTRTDFPKNTTFIINPAMTNTKGIVKMGSLASAGGYIMMYGSGVEEYSMSGIPSLRGAVFITGEKSGDLYSQLRIYPSGELQYLTKDTSKSSSTVFSDIIHTSYKPTENDITFSLDTGFTAEGTYYNITKNLVYVYFAVQHTNSSSISTSGTDIGTMLGIKIGGYPLAYGASMLGTIFNGTSGGRTATLSCYFNASSQGMLKIVPSVSWASSTPIVFMGIVPLQLSA